MGELVTVFGEGVSAETLNKYINMGYKYEALCDNVDLRTLIQSARKKIVEQRSGVVVILVMMGHHFVRWDPDKQEVVCGSYFDD